MLKGNGGDRVPAGFYWNAREWEAQVVPREGAVLNGGVETRYVRLPLWALLVLAPVMGGAFAMFLPFIGFAMVVMYLAGRLRRKFTTTPPVREQAVRPETALPVDVKAGVEVHERKAA